MLRVQVGLTQRQLADKVGIKQPQLARLESAKQLAKLDTLQQIAEAVEVESQLNDFKAWKKYKESEHERKEVYTKLAELEEKQ